MIKVKILATLGVVFVGYFALGYALGVYALEKGYKEGEYVGFIRGKEYMRRHAHESKVS